MRCNVKFKKQNKNKNKIKKENDCVRNLLDKKKIWKKRKMKKNDYVVMKWYEFGDVQKNDMSLVRSKKWYELGDVPKKCYEFGDVKKMIWIWWRQKNDMVWWGQNKWYELSDVKKGDENLHHQING